MLPCHSNCLEQGAVFTVILKQPSVVQVGVNFADVFTCLGLYQAAPKENVVPGLEVLMSPALSS